MRQGEGKIAKELRREMCLRKKIHPVGRANSSRRNMKNEAKDEISGLTNCNIIRGGALTVDWD